jgi:hypothetical protein
MIYLSLYEPFQPLFASGLRRFLLAQRFPSLPRQGFVFWSSDLDKALAISEYAFVMFLYASGYLLGEGIEQFFASFQLSYTASRCALVCSFS